MGSAPAGTVHHIEINVNDLGKSLEFWSWLLERFGYQGYQQWEEGRSFRRGGTYLVFVQTGSRYKPQRYHRSATGLNHIAFHAGSREEVDELTETLRGRGVRVLYEDDHPFAGGRDHYAVFFEDPDRIKVEVVAPETGIEYRDLEGPPSSADTEKIDALHRTVFGNADTYDLNVKLSRVGTVLTQLALRGEQLAGFKIGYERKPQRFYSWLGGVHPQFRGQGIGSELMRRQHAWAQSRGYRTVRTHTKNQWRDMIVLNLRHGFGVIGSYVDEQGEPKLILEKDLPPAGAE